jgi:murein DD-endopeptidase MepM/ murein hydrolase activator NlpD
MGQPPAPPPTITYTVKPGDTLTGIARRHGVTVGEIFAANPSLSQKGFEDPYIESHSKDPGVPPDKIQIPQCKFNPNKDPAKGTIGCAPHIETVCDMVALIKKVEAAHPDWSADRVAAALRNLGGYDDSKFRYFYGTSMPFRGGDSLAPGGGLTRQDIHMLRVGLFHYGSTPETETGISYDPSTGEYVSLGHTLTGISAGMHYNSDVYGANHVNNLYATTIAGDIGQRAALLAHSGVLALEGEAQALGDHAFALGVQATKLEQEALTAPEPEASAKRNLAASLRRQAEEARRKAAATAAEAAAKRQEADMEATPAEIAGDLDGFSLGAQIRDKVIDPSKTKLSAILSDYYGCGGQANPRSKQRREIFSTPAAQGALRRQSSRFAELYLDSRFDSEANADKELDESMQRFLKWQGP